MPTLTGLPALITRIRVLATSAISYLTAISAALVALAQQLDGIAGVPEWLTRTIASAVAAIAVIILQVRRVTPVDDSQKGLLPPKGPAVGVEGADRGLAFIEVAVLLVAIGLVIVAIKVY